MGVTEVDPMISVTGQSVPVRRATKSISWEGGVLVSWEGGVSRKGTTSGA